MGDRNQPDIGPDRPPRPKTSALKRAATGTGTGTVLSTVTPPETHDKRHRRDAHHYG